MNHYETLGVEKDASQEKIKKAYRAKAKKVHPDIGGSQAEFEPVVKAYEVLKNPDSRQLYDATGTDERRLPIEVDAQNILLQLFQKCLIDNIDIGVINSVKNTLDGQLQKIPGVRLQAEKAKIKLLAKRDGIHTTNELNLVHVLIDKQVNDINACLVDYDRKEKIAMICLEILKEYTEDGVFRKQVINITRDINGFSYRGW